MCVIAYGQLCYTVLSGGRNYAQKPVGIRCVSVIFLI